jgi:Flp pilus assembly protein TadG
MNRQRGQVLPLFALMLVALFGIAGLAVDVSSGYSARQGYRTASDAAALAGAQNLQTGATRAVGAPDRKNARTDALESLKNAFGAQGTSGAACNPNDDVVQINNCQLKGTPIFVSIKTPSPTCAQVATCNPNHAVQVTVSNPTFQLSFSRVLGVDHWNVATTSVAGLGFSASYALVTLRPPSADSVPGVRDIEINGGTQVVVHQGDVGSNANMIYGGAGSGSRLIVDAPDYAMYYYDPFHGPLWTPPSPPDPPGTKIGNLILDPGYIIPSSAGGTPYASKAAALDGTLSMPSAACQSIVNTYLSGDPGYDVVVDNGGGGGSKSVIPKVAGGAIDWSHVFCYKPGVYSFSLTDNNSDLSILEPGLYVFNQGIGGSGSGGINGSLVGGYQAGSQGVALEFPRDEQFKGRNAVMVSLNAGTKLGSPSGTEATAAHDYSTPFNLVETNTNPRLLMTLMVQRDSKCTPVLPFPSACDNTEENQNDAIDLSGGSALYLAGVQFGPSDNMKIAGNTSSGGYVGQIVAWTVFYTGGSTIRQDGPTGPHLGILRLDAACTAPGTPCNP